jgi:hypothetical protein
MPVLQCVRSVVVESEWLASGGQRQRFTEIGSVFKMGVLIKLLQQIQYVRIISSYKLSDTVLQSEGENTVGVDGCSWSGVDGCCRVWLLVVFEGQRVE